MYICLIPKSFRVILLYSCKFVDKEILRIVSNIGIYCPNDKVGTVYPVQYIFENSSVNINALFSSCEDMAFCSSECILTFLYAGDNNHYKIEQFVSCIHFCSVHFTIHPFINKNLTWRSTAGGKKNRGRQIQTAVNLNSSISETFRNRTHVYINFFA